MALDHDVTPFFEHLGPRAQRRATPRLGPVLGGAAAALVFLGVVVLSFDRSLPDDFDDDPDNFVGALLCALAVAAGYFVVHRFRVGAAATAGSAVAAAALPFVFVFLTYDEVDAPPFSLDATLLVSTAAWAGAYVLGATRGRPLFLGLAAVGLWLFIIEQVEPIFSAPFLAFAPVPELDEFGVSPSPPDFSTVGFVSLLFGAGYVVAGHVLDRRRLAGAATPLLVSGYLALAIGYLALADELEMLGTGLLVAATGVLVALLGVRVGRRATAWLGAGAAGFGLFLLVMDIFEDSDDPTGPAVTLIIVGAALAAAAEWWAQANAEPTELALPPSSPAASSAAPSAAPSAADQH
jgi:drug/metabolite transporter (DMT)-like permease